MKLLYTPSLFHSRPLRSPRSTPITFSHNPLSLMNTSHLFRNFVFLFSLLGLGSFAWGDRFVVKKSVGNAFSNYIDIAESETAIIVGFQVSTSGSSGYGNIYYTDSNGSENIIYQYQNSYVPSHLSLEIAGPCRLRVKQTYNTSSSNYYARILVNIKQFSPPTSAKFATVIPENSDGNVSIILEQSTDLINWTAASPGVFPPSTAKRFFRVRSEEE